MRPSVVNLGIWGQLRDLRTSEARTAKKKYEEKNMRKKNMRPQKNVTKSYFYDV